MLQKNDSGKIIPYNDDDFKALLNIYQIEGDFLADIKDREFALTNLHREFERIPPEIINEFRIPFSRLLIAASTGLFDAAINYIWNIAIINLRQKVTTFGLSSVQIIFDSSFSQDKLFELKDFQLLKLCLDLNLINEEAYYFLDQCRDTRNHFSIAHPSIGEINDRELTIFVNRCIRYTLLGENNPTGVEINSLINQIKNTSFDESELEIWSDNISRTHEAQRESIFTMLYGMYCDSNMTQETRLNCLNILINFSNEMAPNINNLLISKHNQYFLEGKKDKIKASTDLFERLNKLSLLSDISQARIYQKALKNLYKAHMGFDNFYTEPPFAERLLELREQMGVPDSIQKNYVNTITLCAIGNTYGVSNLAINTYKNLISKFSPREIAILIDIKDENNLISNRINNSVGCKNRYKDILQLIDKNSIPKSKMAKFEQILLS